MKRSAAQWGGNPSIIYEAGGSRVEIVPARGGKIVSICGPGGSEWLIPLESGAAVGPGHAFIDAEMCGWDECAPSLDPAAASSGATIADHGELWDQPWRVEPDSDRLSADLPSVRATFSRTVALAADGRIRLDYEVVAGSESFAFLWAAHPQFSVDVADSVVMLGAPVLPWDVSDQESEPMPAAGRRRTFSLSEVSPGGSRKLYLDPSDRVGGVAIERVDGSRLTMTWDFERLPYLGLWFDRAEFADRETVAVEPTTGWYDSVERAAALGRVRVIEAGARFGWWVELVMDASTVVDPV